MKGGRFQAPATWFGRREADCAGYINSRSSKTIYQRASVSVDQVKRACRATMVAIALMVLPPRFVAAITAIRLHQSRRDLKEALREALGRDVALVEPGPVPPPELIAATSLMSKSDLQLKSQKHVYLAHSYRSAAWILNMARAAGLTFREGMSIFELGCGEGRLISHLRALPRARLVASDVRADTIKWCRNSLPGIEFHVNELEPPVAFLESNSVDLAIAQSVFTHIPLAWQRAWLEEIARVIRPGGIFWCTIIGQHHIDVMLDKDARQILEETGEFELDGKDPRSSYSTQLIGSWDVFQTEPVVRREFGRYFEIANYQKNPAGPDVLVMRVPPLG